MLLMVAQTNILYSPTSLYHLTPHALYQTSHLTPHCTRPHTSHLTVPDLTPHTSLYQTSHPTPHTSLYQTSHPTPHTSLYQTSHLTPHCTMQTSHLTPHCTRPHTPHLTPHCTRPHTPHLTPHCTRPHCYSMCTSAYLNGDGVGKLGPGAHALLLVFFVAVLLKSDDLVGCPFTQSVHFNLLLRWSNLVGRLYHRRLC